MTQARLFGDAEDELARLAVLVAGRQLQRGQLLHRVLIQHQALVHHHGRRKTVLWRREEDGKSQKKRRGRGNPSKQRFISKSTVAFHKFMKTIHPKGDKNTESRFFILVKNEKYGPMQWRRKKVRLMRGGEKIRGAEGYIRSWRNGGMTQLQVQNRRKIKSGDGKGGSKAHQEV